jgi:hypothetical protein
MSYGCETINYGEKRFHILGVVDKGKDFSEVFGRIAELTALGYELVPIEKVFTPGGKFEMYDKDGQLVSKGTMSTDPKDYE